MADFNITALADDDLEALRVEVLTEQERRANLAQIPTTIANLSRAYREGGGDESALIDAVTHTPEPEHVTE